MSNRSLPLQISDHYLVITDSIRVIRLDQTNPDAQCDRPAPPPASENPDPGHRDHHPRFKPPEAI